jgi:hypothetical protein
LDIDDVRHKKSVMGETVSRNTAPMACWNGYTLEQLTLYPLLASSGTNHGQERKSIARSSTIYRSKQPADWRSPRCGNHPLLCRANFTAFDAT